METDEIKKIKHVAGVIVFGFIGSVIAFGFMFAFPAPDFTKPIPVYSEGGVICSEISMALFIFGCTVLGLKLTEEKKTLPAAGFTMMAISQGVVFILNFMNFNSEETLLEIYKTYCGSLYLLLPAMALIAFYSDFPKWLNALGVLACVPQIWVFVRFMQISKYETSLETGSFLSMILFNITALCWAIYVWRNMKKEIAALQK